MPITINGSGTVTGITAGGLPDGVITTDDIAANAVTYAKIGTTEQGQLCKAWVNFAGGANTNLTGTYSQSGTTVTVTATAHGLIAGNTVFADITSGTGVDGTYTVATVTDANTFTYTAGTSLTTSGNITLVRNTIRASYNVSSITDRGTGAYSVNFTTAMPDANYAVVGIADQSANVNTTAGDHNTALTGGGGNSTTAAPIYIISPLGNSGPPALVDAQTASVAIFR